jgi:hypothetical protein
MSTSKSATEMAPPGEREEHHAPPLFIFVNRRRFTTEDGVKPRMTGAEIAALVGLPADQAVVRQLHGTEQKPVEPNETVDIHRADQFVVTRRIVEGG